MHRASDVAEGILKRYGVPLVVVSPVSTAVVFAAYLGHERFSMPKDPPLLDLSEFRTNDLPNPITRMFPPMPPVLPAPNLRLTPVPRSTRTVAISRSPGTQVSLVRVALKQ